MPTQARTPADHYQEAERLLDLADDTAAEVDTAVLQQIRAEALAEATVHAVLALAPRRVRRQRRDRDDLPLAYSPRHRWLFGGDES